MSEDLIPVLWLCGPAGVGKTAIGWDIYSQLLGCGIHAGYVDIDQLGICYPEPASDPGRYRMKTRNLAAVIASFRAAGAGCVVVSGVVDPIHGVETEQLPHVALTMCRLRADRDELRQRFVGRQAQVRQVDEVLREANEMDTSTVADLCVDTTGLSVAEVARQVQKRASGWLVPTGPSRPSAAASLARHTASAADGPILWLTGVTGVGTSTVGFTLYQRTLLAGFMAAYIDLDQVGFCASSADHGVKANSLTTMWQTYHAAGAQGLVMVGPVENAAAVALYADTLPAAAITLCPGYAPDGSSWAQPGDPLRGQSTTHLLRVVDEAVAAEEALERTAVGLRVDTDRRTVNEVADTVLTQSGWLDQISRQ